MVIDVYEGSSTRFRRPGSADEVLLMEGIHENAMRVLSAAGFENIETHATAFKL